MIPSSRTTTILPTSLQSSSSASNDNMPTQDEISQQKSEAYNALSSYHETSTSFTSSSSTQIQSLLQGLDTIGMTTTELDEENKAEYWSCNKGAITYPITMDRSQGLKKGIISKPYKCPVQIEIDLGELSGRTKRKGLRLVESWNNDESSSMGGSSIPFVRSIPLNDNVDVDAADGSYSLDDSSRIIEADDEEEEEEPSAILPLLPSSLLGGIQQSPTYVIEHTLAVSETERCRCFLLYGNDDEMSINNNNNIVTDDKNEMGEEDDFAVLAAKQAKQSRRRKENKSKKRNGTEKSYVLTGVILAEETKVMPKEDEKLKDDDTDDDYAADFISQMIETTPATATSYSPSSPLDLLQIADESEGNEEDDKMNRLMKSIDKHNQRVMDSAMDDSGGVGNALTKMEMTSIGMFGLTSGVWLGDTFIREHISPELYRARQTRDQKTKTKGFGSKKRDSERDDEDEGEDMFATWCMGVQKVALLFSWDYHRSFTQSYTWGKCMGTPTSFSSMANIKSDGIVVVNEGRRTKNREEKRVIFDIDGVQYVGGLIGSVYFKAPRYMTFSPTKEYSAEAWVTEFLVFYQPVKGDDEAKSLDAPSEEEVVPEHYCSRIARLIANDGSLLQGSTAFFSLKQALADE